MEVELEPRVKPLGYKVKGMSRESPSQKASHVLETDLRSHWSTGTNTKEWILFELDEPCLLSHIRIYNKSVLEWEIAVGLRYKPETFVKVRPRCEAPRRDMVYPMNYTPCRYVRISCLRGNPIAIFFVQLIGISLTGLEPEFQPVVNHLLPHIIANKQDAHDMHLQLLQDITNRLLVFLPQLEADLTSFADSPEENLRFLAMLVGPLYPILHIVNEREAARSSCNISDSEVSKHIQPSSFLTVSSNFEPRRSRSTSPFVSSAASSIVFRPDVVFMLLRMAHRDSDLGSICVMASRILHKLVEPILSQEALAPRVEVVSASDDMLKSELSDRVSLVDYSTLFGEEFCMPNDQWDLGILNVLDVAAVEEGILHVLYACASQSFLCHKLAESIVEFWSALPLVQALLPALRPSLSSLGENVDNSFSQWRQPYVQQALSQIVATSCSAVYHPLLHACSGYLSSFSQSHAKAACILIDLCSSILAPWMNLVIAKVDLAMELLEDLLGTILDARHSLVRARAALKYIILALSGQMDDVLGKYKEVKHKILFLLEMLEPFLDPAIYVWKSSTAFGDVSITFLENQEQACVVALNVIRMAVQKPAVLPSLESEWRNGSVAPSVLLSVLEPHMQLPPEIDLCKYQASKDLQHEFSESSHFSVPRHGGTTSRSNNQDEADGKTDVPDIYLKVDLSDDANLFFAPPELQALVLTNVCKSPKVDSNRRNANSELKYVIEENFNRLFHSGLVFDAKFSPEFFNLQADYFQLVNYRDSEIRASEFQRLALDLLHSQDDLSLEGHDAVIDALLLAAECYVNPFFMISFRPSSPIIGQENINQNKISKGNGGSDLGSASSKIGCDLDSVANLEKERDKVVLQLVLEAAELYEKFQSRMSDGQQFQLFTEGGDERVIKLSPHDVKSADAITLVRQNQALLFNFLIWRLKKEQNSMHEILMHCLIFLLHSATQLYCDPEEVIDIILGFAEYLNRLLTSIFSQFKEGNLQLDPEKLHGLQRRWILLLKLVVASSSGEGTEFRVNRENRFRSGNLIPPSAWMHRISSFSQNACPLVRFLGWMAVSRNAKHYCKDRLFLASDLHNLTNLLSIFVDELSIVDNICGGKSSNCKDQPLGLRRDLQMHDELQLAGSRGGGHSFHVVFPDLSKFFPCLQEQFQCFGESILEAVGLQLRSLSSGFVPDILCWFSSLCSWPFFQSYQFGSQNTSGLVKGYVAKNAKAIILYILEAIVIEHMESMVPEIPRVVQALAVLCRAPYCDVSFLDSIICFLKPIISYSLHKVLDEEKVADNDFCLNFESLCFDELFVDIKMINENRGISADEDYSRALTVFILASVFTDLSFPCMREILQSLTFWADFTAFEPTNSFHDYLSAFQAALESCKVLLVQTLEVFGAVPLQSAHSSDFETGTVWDNSLATPDLQSWFLKEVCHNSCQTTSIEKLDGDKFDARQKNCLSADEIVDFSEDLKNLISKLNPSIEHCWNLHPRQANKLTITSAQCLVYLRCLSSIASHVQHAKEGMQEDSPSLMISVDKLSVHWRIALGALVEMISKLQENHCWEVSSLMLDCLLAVPSYFWLENAIDSVCTVIKVFACCAPKISWRLRADRWLSTLFRRGVHGVQEGEGPLTDLFVTLLGHPEPEQRFVVLQHLARLVGLDIISEAATCASKCCDKLLSPALLSVPESFLSLLVSSTWDLVLLLASSDTLFTLRVHAMALLVGYIPYATRHQLQSFLAASDVFFKGTYGTCEGPVLRLSLALLAGACLYSPAEDIPLIPQDVWRNIETIGSSRTGKLGDLEKNVCEAMCKLRNGDDEANQVLKEALSSSSTKQVDPDFGSTRESILQVLPHLTSVQSCFDMFSKRIDQEAIELEEAEIELEVLQKEDTTQEQLKYSVEERQNMLATCETMKNDGRLQQIKDQIDSINKSKLREEIVARRQKKLLMRHARRKYLEEAALREEELLRELDRERMAEAEKDIERQRLLEVERAKTRELRHHLEMEKERQIQRELQREQEQTETGIRSSRREFPSSTHSSRPRDRYRERENGRASMEGGARTTGGGLQPESSSASTIIGVPVVLSSSRQFAGQPPTMLQSRDRSDECGSSYEENFDGSRDSGDTGSVGDPDSVSVLDGQSGGFGSTQRHGSRGSKPRQIMERRERDGRREGKWERKNS